MRRSIVITGASSGIGQALACRLASPESTLGLLGRDETRLRSIAAECQQRGAQVQSGAIDVCEREQLNTWLVKFDTGAPIDLLVVNAGVMGRIDDGRRNRAGRDKLCRRRDQRARHAQYDPSDIAAHGGPRQGTDRDHFLDCGFHSIAGFADIFGKQSSGAELWAGVAQPSAGQRNKSECDLPRICVDAYDGTDERCKAVRDATRAGRRTHLERAGTEQGRHHVPACFRF